MSLTTLNTNVHIRTQTLQSVFANPDFLTIQLVLAFFSKHLCECVCVHNTCGYKSPCPVSDSCSALSAAAALSSWDSSSSPSLPLFSPPYLLDNIIPLFSLSLNPAVKLLSHAPHMTQWLGLWLSIVLSFSTLCTVVHLSAEPNVTQTRNAVSV